jgi:hypothetical protein
VGSQHDGWPERKNAAKQLEEEFLPRTSRVVHRLDALYPADERLCAPVNQSSGRHPVLISDGDEIIAGHGRVQAAKLLGMQSVPTLRLSHLDATQRRAYVIADNKLALNAVSPPSQAAWSLRCDFRVWENRLFLDLYLERCDVSTEMRMAG